jgi:Transposase, Mutator family
MAVPPKPELLKTSGTGRNACAGFLLVKGHQGEDFSGPICDWRVFAGLGGGAWLHSQEWLCHQEAGAAENQWHRHPCLGGFYPEALWQRCTVHFYRNVWTAVPTSKVKEVAAMLKAIHAQEDRAAARQKAEQVAAKLKEMKLADAAALVVAGIEETLYYYAFPREHWRCLRTNNPLERLLREVRRRTRAVGAFPDGKSALMLAAARLRHVAGTKWGTRRYLDMNRLAEASEAA